MISLRLKGSKENISIRGYWKLSSKILWSLYSQHTLSEDQLITLETLNEELDKIYTNLAKGAFIRSRAKWLEDGGNYSSYFFSLEKRNGKRNNIVSLNVNGNISSDLKFIANHITLFYSKLCPSEFDQSKCDKFMEHLKKFTPLISENFKEICDGELLSSEITNAVHSVK